MTQLEQQDWNELVGLLKETEESLSALSVGDAEKEIEKSRRSLMSFHTTSAMLGLETLEKAGLELEKFLTREVSPGSVDSIAVLGFAVSSVIDQMGTFTNGNGGVQIDLNEILELLGQPATTESVPVADELAPVAPETGETIDDETGPETLAGIEESASYSKLNELVRSWGGELSVSSDGAQFSLTITGSAEYLQSVEQLLSAEEPSTTATCGLGEDVLIEKVVARGKEFMDAFSQGDLPRAQEILLNLADGQKHGSVLYKEIGSLARGLHDSIRGFLSTLDPSLQEIVVNTIPDSGNRLEHMMEMTEKAAITTLDHVEAMQERLTGELGLISNLRALLGGLHAIGDAAAKKLADGAEALNAMETIIGEHRSDLDTILTAQDYQDLSGQIILKISQLLKDMERKLVDLIRTFGVKPVGSKKPCDELYGPAHAAMDNAVHSQDDVDSLLADFGF